MEKNGCYVRQGLELGVVIVQLLPTKPYVYLKQLTSFRIHPFEKIKFIQLLFAILINLFVKDLSADFPFETVEKNLDNRKILVESTRGRSLPSYSLALELLGAYFEWLKDFLKGRN